MSGPVLGRERKNKEEGRGEVQEHWLYKLGLFLSKGIDRILTPTPPLPNFHPSGVADIKVQPDREGISQSAQTPSEEEPGLAMGGGGLKGAGFVYMSDSAQGWGS